MKGILISIMPMWCELIASGKKTVEVRKTRPNIDTPFKCYIYETLTGYNSVSRQNDVLRPHIVPGKVIGEFVCDCITPLYNICVDKWELLQGGLHTVEKNIVRMANLSENELKQYANGKYPLFAWHISDLVIYDKPKALRDFGLKRAPWSWRYVEEVNLPC